MIVVCINPLNEENKPDGITEGKCYEAIDTYVTIYSILDDYGNEHVYLKDRFVTQEEWINRQENKIEKKEMILVCKNPSNGLTKGRHYNAVETSSSHQYNLISIIDDSGVEYFYSKNRFITLEQWKENARRMLLQKKTKNEPWCRKMERDY
jgi:uncharacterized protein YrzB (UPF0473 family)